MTSKMKNKYHILLVVRWPVGGIRTFLRYVYNRLDPAKYELTIIAPDIEELKVLLEDLNKFDIDYKPTGEGISNFRLARLIYRTLSKKKFDMIHSQGFTSGLCATIPARLKSVEHLMTSHDVLRKDQFLGLKGVIKRGTLTYLLPKIDVVHSVSNDAQENLLSTIPSLKEGSNRYTVVLNGIETDRFKGTDRRDFHDELSLSNETFLIGFLGRFMSQKGLLYLVEAIDLLYKEEKLPKQPIVLTFGCGGFIREDTKMISDRGLDKYFRFLPFSPNVAEALKGLDLVAIPSLWEACPLLPMEAMVAGVPVIGTDCLGLREVLRDTPSVVVPAANSRALAEAIANEIRNPSRKAAESFIEAATMRFDVKKQVEELKKVIQRLLDAS